MIWNTQVFYNKFHFFLVEISWNLSDQNSKSNHEINNIHFFFVWKIIRISKRMTSIPENPICLPMFVCCCVYLYTHNEFYHQLLPLSLSLSVYTYDMCIYIYIHRYSCLCSLSLSSKLCNTHPNVWNFSNVRGAANQYTEKDLYVFVSSPYMICMYLYVFAIHRKTKTNKCNIFVFSP